MLRRSLFGVLAAGLAAWPDFGRSSQPSEAPAIEDLLAGTSADGLSHEARLIQIYRLIGAYRAREALPLAEALVRDAPNFRLAHLVYADLLTAVHEPLGGFGSGAMKAVPGASAAQVEPLHSEAMLRLNALRELPPRGTVPSQFLALPSTTRHAIAVDASRSRLYLLQHGAEGLQLRANFYVSIGRSGVDKRIEGDRRTPLGVYFITSRIEAGQLSDFYGAGALPLNYPNEYDRRNGRTGGGIWLHGVSREDYAREPRATDGCVVLANDDLRALLTEAEIGRTPVVIAQRLEWVTPGTLEPRRRDALDLLAAWNSARAAADAQAMQRFYLPDVTKVSLRSGRHRARRDAQVDAPQSAEIKEVSVLAWHDERDLLVVTFGEVTAGKRSGHVMRQYWAREGNEWKIFYEGVIS